MDEITLGITIFLLLVVFVPYLIRFRKKEAEARRRLEEARLSGLVHAYGLHPKINASLCIGCGSCVKACPEGDVLAVVDGKATIVNGASCVGHGLCAEACPVGAIELGLGSPTQIVEIPVVDGNYETNIPGIFIIGELGGVGLIRNAVEQAKKCVNFIASNKMRSRSNNTYDVVIVGAGPAGLTASLSAIENGLRYVTLEQETDIGGTILHYPRHKIVMTFPVEIPLYGKFKFYEVPKEVLYNFWIEIIRKYKVDVRTNQKVVDVVRKDGEFIVVTETGQIYRGANVVLALGRRGSPRRLGVPGEELGKVSYKLIEAENYNNCKILIVGGGDSAIEAAMALANQKGNEVIISYRGDSFKRIKPRNRERIEKYILENRIRPIFNSNVVEIKERSVVLDVQGEIVEIPNDYVFIFIGGTLSFEFLKKIGVEIKQLGGS